MLILDSVFINNSGGKSLLDYLVREIENNKIEVFYLFDKRCANDFLDIPSKRKKFINGSLLERHKFYKSNIKKFTKVCCFGNIPPTVKLNIPVYTYFHNVSLLQQPELYSLKEKFIKWIKGKVIIYLSKNTDYFLVQTNEVKNLLRTTLKSNSRKLLVVPFFDVQEGVSRGNKENAFIFVSNGNTHKNHLNLLTAWEELAKRNLYPELHLTVTANFEELIGQINDAVNRNIKVVNHGYTNPYPLYSSCKYLIFPSLCESFGLGLIEAVKCGCDVIASDLPYVYEVVKPTATFDPLDSTSIADAVEDVLSNQYRQKTELVVKNQIEELLELIRP